MTPGQRQRFWRARGLAGMVDGLVAKGQHRAAEAATREAIQIFRSLLGEDHPSYASSLNDLGTLYQDRGDYRRAEPLFRRSLEIYKKALGEDHPFYADGPSRTWEHCFGRRATTAARRAAPPPGDGDPQEGRGRRPPRLRQQPQ